MSVLEDRLEPLPAPNAADREGFAAFLLRMRIARIDDKALMTAIESVPRRGFVAPAFRNAVWSSRMLPIECGETIEGLDLQARMIHALQLEEKHRILEIGTGSGFTAAVLAKQVRRVYTLDRYRTLVRAAQHRFREMKLDNVIAQRGDGAKGSADGPFDRIISWVAFETVPRAFIDQLATGGLIVCAVGHADAPQTLMRLTKVGSRFDREDLGEVRFQPISAAMPMAL